MVITWLREQTIVTNMAPCVARHGLCDATEGEEGDEEEEKREHVLNARRLTSEAETLLPATRAKIVTK